MSNKQILQRLPLYVLYDGDCATCHFVVKWLLRRANRDRFRFMSLRLAQQSPHHAALASQLRDGFGSSVIVIRNGEVFEKSDSIFAILAELGWMWLPLRLGKFFPKIIRDFCYDLYAKNRYKIAGKAKDSALCELVEPSARQLLVSKFPPVYEVFEKNKRVFLSSQWLNLVMINYEVPRALLEPYVPAGTELDGFEGTVLCSLVGFLFANAFVKGMRMPSFSDFEEVNLRFYVTRTEIQDGIKVSKRGVVFIKELVPKSFVALLARVIYNENYKACPMSHRFETESANQSVTYGWKNDQSECSVKAMFQGEPCLPKEGSLEEYISEHYYGYARQRDGGTVEYKVEHPRWRVWQNCEVEISGNFESTYGQEFAEYLKKSHSAFVAEGSAVRVLEGHRL
jgi:predicted DCC family thiol-disulfide oxidoreductase YuxK/uncharacterized protein YqjF (DUF2071 family)